MPAISINKLLKTSHNAGDKKNYIYLKTIWDDEKVIVKALDSESGISYQGTLTSAAIEEKATDLGMLYEDYYDEIRSALTNYLALPGFYYKIEDMEVINVWKKSEAPDGIPILFLDIDIKKVTDNCELLDSAVDLLHEKEENLLERAEKAHKYDKQSLELLEDYRLCVEEKKELERNLLKKVAVLLNSKKKRILELEERLRRYEDMEENEDKTDTDENEEEPRTSKKQRLMVMDSESDSDSYIADTQPLDVSNTGTNSSV